MYFCPSAPGSLSLSDLPSHPMLDPVFRCEQFLTMRYSRCLITMEKTRAYNAAEVDAFHQQTHVGSMSVADVHDIVFEKRSEHTSSNATAIPKFRCKQL